MNSTRRPTEDALVTRVHDVAQLVADLRGQVARLEGDLQSAREQLLAARGEMESLSQQKVQVRDRVKSMLEMIHG